MWNRITILYVYWIYVYVAHTQCSIVCMYILNLCPPVCARSFGLNTFPLQKPIHRKIDYQIESNRKTTKSKREKEIYELWVLLIFLLLFSWFFIFFQSIGFVCVLLSIQFFSCKRVMLYIPKGCVKSLLHYPKPHAHAKRKYIYVYIGV